MEKNPASCIQTYSGNLIDLANPSPEDISVPDIAHQLSNITRYTGACRKFYSVAQHCVLVSRLMESDNARNPYMQLVGLLHDATEAYLGDISTPLKTMLPDYRALEDKMKVAILKRFDLQVEGFEDIKFYDRLALDLESKALMGPRHPMWDRYKVVWIPEYEMDWSLATIHPLPPEDAERQYLQRFHKLWLEKV